MGAVSEEDEREGRPPPSAPALPSLSIKILTIPLLGPVKCIVVSMVAGGGRSCGWPGRRQVSWAPGDGPLQSVICQGNINHLPSSCK